MKRFSCFCSNDKLELHMVDRGWHMVSRFRSFHSLYYGFASATHQFIGITHQVYNRNRTPRRSNMRPNGVRSVTCIVDELRRFTPVTLYYFIALITSKWFACSQSATSRGVRLSVVGHCSEACCGNFEGFSSSA